MTFEEFRVAAILVPFKIGGRDWSGWDCWGLIYCARQSIPELGGPVKSYAVEYDEKLSYPELADMISREKSEWRFIGKGAEACPLPGDIGLYRVGRWASHVALVAPGSRMLHCEKSVGTVSEPLTNGVWANRNVGFYRWN